VNIAVETNLRKQAEVLHGIDANMHAFGDILQQSASTQQDVSRQFETLLRDYQQVRDDVAQGLGFYSQLQEAVKTLHKEIGDYSLARYTESTDRGSSGGRWLFGKGSPWSALPSTPVHSHSIKLGSAGMSRFGHRKNSISKGLSPPQMPGRNMRLGAVHVMKPVSTIVAVSGAGMLA